jgi:sec-independent protein translocase protein TatB
MFDSIGWGEVLVLAVAALFIFGPDRLPSVARDAAAGLKRVRSAVTAVRGQLHEELGQEFPQLANLDLRQYRPEALIRQHLIGDDVARTPGGGPPPDRRPSPPGMRTAEASHARRPCAFDADAVQSQEPTGGSWPPTQPCIGPRPGPSLGLHRPTTELAPTNNHNRRKAP